MPESRLRMRAAHIALLAHTRTSGPFSSSYLSTKLPPPQLAHSLLVPDPLPIQSPARPCMQGMKISLNPAQSQLTQQSDPHAYASQAPVFQSRVGCRPHHLALFASREQHMVLGP